jgi:hypothetical protein
MTATVRVPIPLRHLALGMALGELGRGVREEGPNWSPRIQAYHENLDPPIRLTSQQGYAWCAMFVQMVADEAARTHGLRNPLDDVVREALVLDYYTLAKARGWLIEPALADAGDLVIYDFPDNAKSWDHIGLVVQPPARGRSFLAIEGNTDRHGGREGVEVAIRPRELGRYPVVFARWDEGIVWAGAEAA